MIKLVSYFSIGSVTFSFRMNIRLGTPDRFAEGGDIKAQCREKMIDGDVM